VYSFSLFLLLNTNKNLGELKVVNLQRRGYVKQPPGNLCRIVLLSTQSEVSALIEARGMNNLVHWLGVNASVLAVMVTVGVAVLLICCLECSNCSGCEKDELFHRHEL
jgi:hypothetical protein